VKSHVFLKSEKNVKYVFSNTGVIGVSSVLCFICQLLCAIFRPRIPAWQLTGKVHDWWSLSLIYCQQKF